MALFGAIPLAAGYMSYRDASKARRRQKKLMKEYQRAQERANRANETRYQAILGEQNSLYGRTMRGLETVGEAQRQQLREEDRRIQADARQGAISRGMAGTTVASAMQQAATRQTGVAARALEEEARLRKLNADASLTNQRLGFMERKVEQGPDPNVLRMQMGMASAPSPLMTGLNRGLDETYRGIQAVANLMSAMGGQGGPGQAPPSPQDSSVQARSAVAQTGQGGPQGPQMTAATVGGGYYSTDPAQPQTQSAYFGQSAYNDYAKSQRRRSDFY